MGKYRYILEPYKGISTRYACPSCGKREFARYIDTETRQYVNAKVGRCNRQDKCGYHYTPMQYFRDNNTSLDALSPFGPKKLSGSLVVVPQLRSVSCIPFKVFKDSMTNHLSNHFVKFLLDLFGVEVTQKLISRYFIGTSAHWDGATVFWQIDVKGRVRSGKIMLYNPITGKRVKGEPNYITWVHSLLKQPEFELRQCLFGEHLLRGNTYPVALVESEKTAVIASVYLPNLIWLAVGGLNNFNADKCAILAGRKIILYPDLGAFEKWSQIAKSLSRLAVFTVSTLLEQKATNAERQQGLDLADFLIRFNYLDFVKPLKQQQRNVQSVDNKQCSVEQMKSTSVEWAGKWIKESRNHRGDLYQK